MLNAESSNARAIVTARSPGDGSACDSDLVSPNASRRAFPGPCMRSVDRSVRCRQVAAKLVRRLDRDGLVGEARHFAHVRTKFHPGRKSEDFGATDIVPERGEEVVEHVRELTDEDGADAVM
jgi:hypothetical protein